MQVEGFISLWGNPVNVDSGKKWSHAWIDLNTRFFSGLTCGRFRERAVAVFDMPAWQQPAA